MANKKVKKSQSKIKKKSWFSIKAPKSFGGVEVGETLVEDPKLIIGRMVSMNLMTLTRDPKKQGVNIRFKVVSLEQNNAETIFSRYKVMPSSIKRMVRRSKNRLDHSFKCKTVDGVLLTVKPLVLTMNQCNKSVMTALRKKVVSFIFYHVGKKTLDQVVMDIVSSKLQFALKKSLSKLYPVAICELREVSVTEYDENVLKAASLTQPEEVIATTTEAYEDVPSQDQPEEEAEQKEDEDAEEPEEEAPKKVSKKKAKVSETDD